MSIRDKVDEIEARHNALSGSVYLPSGKSAFVYMMAARELPATHADRATLLTIVKAALDVVEAAEGVTSQPLYGHSGLPIDVESALAAFQEVAGND